MKEQTLYTATGKKITKITIPDFQSPYNILIWGSRFFIRNRDGMYLEDSAYMVVPQ